ncbi:MAG: DUF4349 domain-containing protein [Cellulosilyticaceae bacterium]
MKKVMKICLSMLMLVVLLVGCSSKSEVAMDSAKPEMSENKVAMEETYDTGGEYAPEADSESMQGTGNGVQFNTTVGLNRKIIKTGQMDIETKTFDKTMAEIMKQLEVLGGFIQTANTQGYEGSNRSATLTLRIPNAQFDKFMNDTERYGNVLSKTIEGQDVTDQYMDTEMRLNALQIQATRLEELMAQSGDLEDLFTIGQELGRVTYEIESLKGSLKKYDSLIDYSTITVYVAEAREYSKPDPITFGEKIKQQLGDSMDAVTSILKGLVLFFVGLTPFLIILIPIGIVVGVIIKVIRKRDIKRTEKEPKE